MWQITVAWWHVLLFGVITGLTDAIAGDRLSARRARLSRSAWPKRRTDALCSASVAACRCELPAEHDTTVRPHTCRCGGQWVGNIDDDTFEPVTWPQH